MHSKNNGNILRDNKIFRLLMRQGRLKYNFRNVRPHCLKYYTHFVRSKNLHAGDLAEIHFVAWDVLAYAGLVDGKNHRGYVVLTVEYNTYDFDDVPIGASLW